MAELPPGFSARPVEVERDVESILEMCRAAAIAEYGSPDIDERMIRGAYQLPGLDHDRDTLLVLDEERLTALTNTPTAISRNLLLMLMNYLRNKAARTPQPAAPPAPNNHIDALTGLHNQRWLDETLDRLILRAATDRAPLSLIAVDLVDLAGLTEEHGQETLDMLLCELAKTLSSSLRPTDLMARHATGRFVIMLPGANQENTDMVSARVQEIVNSTEVVIPGVSTLPPMKVVMGTSTMSAFVSGRKLVGDAFAALEQNRAILLAVMAEPPTEITIDIDTAGTGAKGLKVTLIGY
jgi:diguanylate cyclase (GGDEF)-like protein